MKRFADNKPPVRRRSECTADAGKGVLDKKTGEQGLIFFVRSVHWKSDTEVIVEGGYYEAGLSSSGNTYTVKKDKGKWKVTNDKLDEIAVQESFSTVFREGHMKGAAILPGPYEDQGQRIAKKLAC